MVTSSSALAGTQSPVILSDILRRFSQKVSVVSVVYPEPPSGLIPILHIGFPRMPQPLSRMKSDFKAISPFNGNSKAHIASPIFGVIRVWSVIDNQMSRLLSELLRSDFRIVSQMYQTLASAEARRAALLAAASSALGGRTDERYAIVQAILEASRPSRDKRNEFAHYIWLDCPDLPDSLILLNPGEYMFAGVVASREYSEQLESVIRDSALVGEITQPTDLPPVPAPDYSKYLVYSKQELDVEYRNAYRCLVWAVCLSRAFKQDAAAVKIWNALSADPPIQHALQKITSSATS